MLTLCVGEGFLRLEHCFFDSTKLEANGTLHVHLEEVDRPAAAAGAGTGEGNPARGGAGQRGGGSRLWRARASSDRYRATAVPEGSSSGPHQGPHRDRLREHRPQPPKAGGRLRLTTARFIPCLHLRKQTEGLPRGAAFTTLLGQPRTRRRRPAPKKQVGTLRPRTRYRVRGKPSSIELEAGSGQRLVITFARV